MIPRLDGAIKDQRRIVRDQLTTIVNLRSVAEREEAILAMFGFRNNRTRRAPQVKLRAPTEAHKAMARQMIDKGMQKHRIEAWFNKHGVRMTRNMLSRMYGARK